MRFTNILIVVILCLVTSALGQNTDLNVDGQVSCHDVDRLFQEIHSFNTPPDLAFDFSGDGELEKDDVDAFFAAVSRELGIEIIRGDFDFDGDVDRRDFFPSPHDTNIRACIVIVRAT